jgi:hypothetical protein
LSNVLVNKFLCIFEIYIKNNYTFLLSIKYLKQAFRRGNEVGMVYKGDFCGVASGLMIVWGANG